MDIWKFPTVLTSLPSFQENIYYQLNLITKRFSIHYENSKDNHYKSKLKNETVYSAASREAKYTNPLPRLRMVRLSLDKGNANIREMMPLLLYNMVNLNIHFCNMVKLNWYWMIVVLIKINGLHSYKNCKNCKIFHVQQCSVVKEKNTIPKSTRKI